jgi:hypothetical protein
MDDLGSGMTDPKPLVMVKQAKTQLEHEISEMVAKISILRYEILHKQLNNLNLKESEAISNRSVSETQSLGKRSEMQRR